MRAELTGTRYLYASQQRIRPSGDLVFSGEFSTALTQSSTDDQIPPYETGEVKKPGLSSQTYSALLGIGREDKSDYQLPEGWEPTKVEGVGRSTGPDGVKWTYIDIDKILTPQDKSILGWPFATDDPNAQLAAMIASDRADGTLTGPLTQDQILGNKEKGIVGLVDRLPAELISNVDIGGLLARL